jgi:hypothetical protein
MPVERQELDTPGMIPPGSAARRADVGNLLVPSEPAAAIGQVNHVIDVKPGWTLTASRVRVCRGTCVFQAPYGALGYTTWPAEWWQLRDLGPAPALFGALKCRNYLSAG